MKLDITGQTLKITAGIETSLNFKPTFAMVDSNVTPLHIDASNILSVNADNRIDEMNMVANLAGVTTISGSVGVGSTYLCTGSSTAYKPDWDSNNGGSIEFETSNLTYTNNMSNWGKIGVGTPVIGYNTFDYGQSYAAEIWWRQTGGNQYGGTNGRWYQAYYYGGTIYGPETLYEYGELGDSTYRRRYALHIGYNPKRTGSSYYGYDYPGYTLNGVANYQKNQSNTIVDRWYLGAGLGNGALIIEKWYHALWVFDIANQLGDGIKIYGYLNGRLYATEEPRFLIGNYNSGVLPDPMSLVNTNDDTNSMSFGGNRDTASAGAKAPPFGRMGEFRLYDRALTSDEVLETYMKTKDRFEPDIGPIPSY